MFFQYIIILLLLLLFAFSLLLTETFWEIILNFNSRIFLDFLSFPSAFFYAWDASFSREGGKGRSQNPDLMNKKSLWLKGDWFVSSWVAFYSALERRGVLIDKSPPLPPWRLWPQSHQVQCAAP